MAETTDIESEQFQTLLSDALRAGPGSPEWHRAVGTLRASGAKGADEMQLLIRAREDLESGKEYRSIKAGPGFTRKVLTAIEDEGNAGGRGIPSANIVALIAAAAILAVVIVVAVVLFKSGPGPTPPKVEQLQALYFASPLAAADFESATEIGPEWKSTGEVPLKVINKGLRPQTVTPVADDKREYRAGVLARSESISPDQPAMIEATFKLKGPPSDAIIPQVFVSDAPIDEARGASAHELVWLLKGAQPQLVKPDMSVPPTAVKLDLNKGGAHTIVVKMRFNLDTVIVETGDKRLYEGPHGLAATGPRYVGVRFLRKVGDSTDGVWLAGVKVLKP